MKRAVSISIGSSKRDKTVDITILGERVRLERIGTDGDMEAAARLYGEMDGKVDAFGVGGAVLGLMVGTKWYVLKSVQSLIKYVHKTPVVDGTGLKITLESQAASVVDQAFGNILPARNAFLLSGVDRYGLTCGFLDAGYVSVIGDMMVSLGIGIPIRSDQGLKRLAAALIPILTYVPFKWLYPTGEAQETRTPKWKKYFDWSTVIAADCHYITRYMPDRLDGKVIVTNTTTGEDRDLFRKAGVRSLVTTTPIYDGRSFGTNMLEAAMVAVLGRREPVDYGRPGDYFQQIQKMVDEMHLLPTIQEL